MVSNTEASITILVVEDDPSVAELVRAVLNDIPGWGTMVAYDAPSAMDLLDHVPADVLVVDVNLPGMSGIELLSRLRRRPNWTDPPAVIMSANVPQSAVVEGLGRDGFTQFIPKPFDIDDLVSAVHDAIVSEPSHRHLHAWPDHDGAGTIAASAEPDQRATTRDRSARVA